MTDKPERTCVIPIHKPGIKEKVFFLLSGLLVSVPFTLFISQFYPNFPGIWSIVLSSIIFAPFIEELAKAYPLFYRHGETERSIVTLGILVGIGFGITELVLYVTLAGATIVERLPGVIFHASSVGITAYGVSKKKPLPYYLLAVLLHSLNNLVAITTFGDLVFVGVTLQIIIVITTFLLAWHFYYKASDEKVVI